MPREDKNNSKGGKNGQVKSKWGLRHKTDEYETNTMIASATVITSLGQTAVV